MTLKETNGILAMITEIYPAFLKDRNPDFTARLWHECFENVPCEKVQAALMEFVSKDTRGFAPVPGMLREIILSHMQSNEMSEMDAWKLLIKAISRSTYFSREEYDKLPESIQNIVRSPQALHEWAAMDSGQIQSSVFPWFRRAYSARVEAERENHFLPSAVTRYLMSENQPHLDAGTALSGSSPEEKPSAAELSGT